MRCLLVVLWVFYAFATQADDHRLLNDEERVWLESLERPLIVATEKYYHPYNFVDENGDMGGVAGDYVRLLQERLGFQYEVRAFETFADVLKAAQAREVDIIPLVVAAPERRGYLSFTQPAYETHDHIFTRTERQGAMSMQDLDGMRVGMVRGYARQAEISAQHPSIDLVLVATELDGLYDLSLGRLDAFISEFGTSSYYIQQEAITNLRVAGKVGQADPQTIASRSDWPVLNTILGKGLASITPDERREIMQRWINVDGVDPGELELIWKKVAAAIGVSAVLLLAALFWTLSLRRQVAKRTKQLQDEHDERRAVEADKLRLAMAVAQSAEFVIVVDTRTHIEYANRSFLDAFGVPDVSGRPFDSLAEGADAAVLATVLNTAKESGPWQGYVTLTRRRGEPFRVLMTVSPIVDDTLSVDGYIVTGRDVTKEEQLEARVRRGEKLSALGTLASGIAHDFNNLLMPIMGYADLMRAKNSPELQPLAEGIDAASERARDLIKRIMAFGRESTGDMVPVDLKAEIDDTLSFLRSLLPATVKLESEIKDCGNVLADRTQIQQILLNLCSNAGDAMVRSGGTLHIQLEQRSVGDNHPASIPPGDYAVLTVSDTGVGIDERTKAKMFDPYFSAKQQASGTGLGLSIVHGIVEAHGGGIDVESTPGEGARFRIYFPLVNLKVAPASQQISQKSNEGSGATILLVDDDELVLGTVDSMLRGLGYQVSAWSDPGKALIEFASEPGAFDAILTDLTMPEMTGVEFARRASEVRKDIPVSIMTGNTSALEDDGAPCISKPMQMSELADHLAELLS